MQVMMVRLFSYRQQNSSEGKHTVTYKITVTPKSLGLLRKEVDENATTTPQTIPWKCSTQIAVASAMIRNWLNQGAALTATWFTIATSVRNHVSNVADQ